MSQQIIEISREYDRSKGFLLGLYLGLLSLLILVSHFDPLHLSPNLSGTHCDPLQLPLAATYIYGIRNLHTATNIYGILALAGAVLGFWRIWKWADKPRRLLSLPSFWICIGSAIWVIAQGLWVRDVRNDCPPYPGLSDIAFIAADLCWLGALLTIFKLVNKLLERQGNPEIRISPFMAILTTVLSLLVGVFLWINHPLIKAPLNSESLFKLGTDFVYILLTFIGMILAVALVNGKNAELPLPVHRCLRYLFVATVINAFATLTFVLTTKLKADDRWIYADGNWIDWLFLTAMYCWGISALKCPIRRDELDYTFGTLRSGVTVEEIYRADEIAKHYSVGVSDRDFQVDRESRQWILDNIPGCWRVAKLGDLVVGSALLFPVPCSFMDNFDPKTMKESEIFEKAKKESIFTWDCLYLADASTLVKHRGRRIALRCFSETIETIADKHPNLKIQVYCWPNIPQRAKLVEKLRAYLKDRREDLKDRVSVISLP